MNATQDDNRRTQRSHAISWLDSSVTRRSFLQTTSKLLAGAAVAPAFFRVNEVNQVIFSPGRNQQAAFTDLFWRKVFGTVNSKIDHTSICEESRHVAHDLFSGSGIQGSKNFTEPDLASGQFVLWFGSDPCSANFPFTAIARKTIDFVQRGGKLYIVDPRCNVAASKGTWIPIKVGTDAALALAIGRYLVDNKLYNEAFLRRPHDAAANPTGELNVTDATLLVKIVDGPPVAFLRADAAGFASGTKDEFVVSAYGGVAKHNAVDAADLLSGPVVVNGITCKTAFELYVERVREKTVEEYAAICGVDVATIQKLATYQELIPGIEDAYPYPVKALIIYWNGIPYSTPAARAAYERVLSNENKLPLVVAIDIAMGEATAWADYVLPDTTYMERWTTVGLSATVITKNSGVRQPVVGTIDPATGDYTGVLPNTKTLEDILIGLGKAMGLQSDLRNAWDYWRKPITNLATQDNGPGLDYVLARGGRFEDYTQAYEGEKQRRRFGARLFFFSERLASTRDSMTGKYFDGVGKYEPVADVFDHPIEARDAGFPLQQAQYQVRPAARSRACLIGAPTAAPAALWSTLTLHKTRMPPPHEPGKDAFHRVPNIPSGKPREVRAAVERVPTGSWVQSTKFGIKEFSPWIPPAIESSPAPLPFRPLLARAHTLDLLRGGGVHELVQGSICAV